MRKLLSRVFLVMMIVVNTFPLVVFAAEAKTAEPNMPYEKVVAKSGDWYSEQFTFETGANLVTGYLGSYEITSPVSAIDFKISEATILKGIYLPYASQAAEAIVITLIDSKGNTYPNFTTQVMSGTITEQANDPNDPTMLAAPKFTYAYIPLNEFVLPAGDY